MRFADITGHHRQIEDLRQMASSGKIPHAILLSGRPGIGKMMVARAFAQYINCSNPQEGDSCGKCPACLQHKSLQFPDLHFIFPSLKKDKKLISSDWIEQFREMLDKHPLMNPRDWNEIIDAGNSQPIIYADDADEIIRLANLSTYSAKHKVFIIWLPEKMNVTAANKLLKIIEEPFGDTIFLLVSNDENQVLPTIFSRTRILRFNPLTDEEISQYLVKHRNLPEGAAREIARLAEGSLESADDMVASDNETTEFRNMFRSVMRACYGRNAVALKECSETMAAMGRAQLRRMLEYFNAQIRENFIYNLNLPELVRLSEEDMAFSSKFAPFIHTGNVERLSEEINRASEEIGRNANAKIVSFDLLLLVMQLIRMPKP